MTFWLIFSSLSDNSSRKYQLQKKFFLRLLSFPLLDRHSMACHDMWSQSSTSTAVRWNSGRKFSFIYHSIKLNSHNLLGRCMRWLEQSRSLSRDQHRDRSHNNNPVKYVPRERRAPRWDDNSFCHFNNDFYFFPHFSFNSTGRTCKIFKR